MTVVCDAPEAVERLLNGHHPTGISTGFLATHRGDWPSLITEAQAFSQHATELSALSFDELPSLARFINANPALPFLYLSVHGPSKRLTTDEVGLVDLLCEIAPFVNSIVMHPDTIQDFGLFRRLGRSLVIENMDRRKNWGRTPNELADVFAELPEAGFCFDIAHAWSVDPSMKLADLLLDSFAPRLRHVHLSSLSEDDRHVPLRNADAEIFTEALRRCVDVPWILEAPLA